MKQHTFLLVFLLLSAGPAAFAKGRRPGNDESFDYSRVKRGSPANPTSAYQPPRFNNDYAPASDSSAQEQDARHGTTAKTNTKAKQQAEVSPEESWTLDSSGAQANVSPANAPSPAAKKAIPAGEGIYEPPLPDEVQPDPLAPAQSKK